MENRQRKMRFELTNTAICSVIMRVVFVLVVVCSISGCRPEGKKKEDELFAKSQALFEQYLVTDVSRARQNLRSEIELLENAGIQTDPLRRATILFLECARLYVLETRCGNREEADVALMKTQYWNLRRFEIDAKGGTPNFTELKTFTIERIVAMVDKSDKERTNGKGPSYLEDIKMRNSKEGPQGVINGDSSRR